MKSFKVSLIVLVLLGGGTLLVWVLRHAREDNGSRGRSDTNTGYESLEQNPLMVIDNEKNLQNTNGKRRITVFRGTNSEVIYLNTTNKVTSPEAVEKP